MNRFVWNEPGLLRPLAIALVLLSSGVAAAQTPLDLGVSEGSDSTGISSAIATLAEEVSLPAVAAENKTGLPFKAGYKNGFFLQTHDGEFKLKIRSLLQIAHLTSFRDIDSAVGDDVESGLVLKRGVLAFSGNAVLPNLGYWFVVSHNRSTSSSYVEECRINYEFENGMFLRVGRMRNPAFLRELDISFARMLGVERSYFNHVFTTGLIEGILLTKQDDAGRAMVFVNDGRHSGSSAERKDFFEDNTDFAVTVGIDRKLAGEWAQFADQTSWCDEGEAVFFGASVHYERGELGDNVALNNQNHFVAWTMDLAYENAGFMMYGAAAGRHQLIAGQAIDQSGALFIASRRVGSEKLEIFSQYEYIDFDGFTDVGANGVAVSDSHVNLVSLGWNYYFNRHAAKLTFQATQALDTVPLAATTSGILADQPTRDGQTVFGTQLQLFF